MHSVTHQTTTKRNTAKRLLAFGLWGRIGEKQATKKRKGPRRKPIFFLCSILQASDHIKIFSPYHEPVTSLPEERFILKGENPKSIYSDLKRSKEWFFKWLRRYKSGGPGWYMGKSRGRLWRWHATWCPGWKRYITSLPDEDRNRISRTYNMKKYQN